MYGSPNATLRRRLRDQLAMWAPTSPFLWVLGGDFNAIASHEERKGGSILRSALSQHFINFLFDMGLHDLKFSGPPFSWCRGNPHQRLDRCIGNEHWVMEYPNSYVHYLERIGSDHRLILLSTGRDGVVDGERPFRFLAA